MKRIINIGKKYESKIYVIDETKSIYKLDCSCYDFKNKRLISQGSVSSIKVYSDPCKHLKPFVERLINIGYKLKKPDLSGSNKCSNELRTKLLNRANNQCEGTKQEIRCQNKDHLHIHRVIRGNAGGKYNKSNCKVLCNECHRDIHGSEFK